MAKTNARAKAIDNATVTSKTSVNTNAIISAKVTDIANSDDLASATDSDNDNAKFGVTSIS